VRVTLVLVAPTTSRSAPPAWTRGFKRVSFFYYVNIVGVLEEKVRSLKPAVRIVSP
jgi:hypothetical protein